MSGNRKTLSRKKKVKILQLYEPKIEEPGNRKQSKKQRDLKNLSNQVKSKFQIVMDRVVKWIAKIAIIAIAKKTQFRK